MPLKPVEEIFLEQLLQEKELSDEMRRQLQSVDFCKGLFQFMDQAEYKAIVMMVVVELNSLHALDLEASFVLEYLRAHAQQVSDYLYRNRSNVFHDETSKDRALLRAALKTEGVYCRKGAVACFGKLWNALVEPGCWRVVLQIAEAFGLTDVQDVLHGLMKGIEKKAAEALAQVLFDSQAQDMRTAAVEAVKAALYDGADIPVVLIVSAFRKMEEAYQSAQRKLRTADRKLKGQGQTLFSAVYEPVERMERLAYNLRNMKKEAPCNIIAKELVDITACLRVGMTQMELYPVCDVEEWRRGHDIPFDAEHHKRPMDAEQVPEMVFLETMGFRYRGDDGAWKQINAQVKPKVSAASRDRKAFYEDEGLLRVLEKKSDAGKKKKGKRGHAQ